MKKDFTSFTSEDLAIWLNSLSCVLVVYVEPILCSIGFLLNCACIAVFLSVSSHGYFRKTSLLTYLIALSACNAIQLLFSVFVIVLPAMEQFIGEEHAERATNLRSINSKTVRLGYPLLLAANYSAIWLLALTCAQRYQAICHPSNPWKMRLSCVRRSKAAVTFVVTVAIALNIIRFWELEWKDDQGIVVNSKLRDHILYKIIQEGLVYGVIVYGLPICLLIWLNKNIIQLIHSEQIHVQPSRRSAEYRTALMTVCVFVVFFLCTTLSASIRLFMIVAGEVVDAVDLVWLVDLSNLLMNINALITPIICFVFTRGFKDLFFVIRFAPKLSIEKVDYFHVPSQHQMLSAEYRSDLI
ncbi:unnamed protein product [Auanema sp. JU1783]|nr:unnamed protein product [Auanema sp. JU1783]